MKYTYCATALMFDNNWVDNSVLEDLCGNTVRTSLAGHPVDLEFYKDDNHLMVKFDTSLLIPGNVYYLDIGFNAEYNQESGQVALSSVEDVVLQMNHANPEAKKIKRVRKGNV